MVAGSDPILLSELGDPPRMGLAAIGQLTRRFDLSVDLSSPSPYGGVRAVLLVKNHLLSHIDPVEQPPAASTPRPTRSATADTPPGGHTPAAAPETAEGQPAAGTHAQAHEPAREDELPHRRRRVRTAAPPTPPKPLPPVRTPEEAAAALGALQSGTAAARSAAQTEGNDSR
jgi:hypothetical protein